MRVSECFSDTFSGGSRPRWGQGPKAAVATASTARPGNALGFLAGDTIGPMLGLKPLWRQGRVPSLVVVGIVVVALFAPMGRTALCAESDKAAAMAHYETATRLYEVREYADALKEFKAAYVAHPDPAFLFNTGQCLRKLGRDTEALDFFQQYLKKTPPEDPNRAAAEARIREFEADRVPRPEAAAKAGAISPPPLTAMPAEPAPAATLSQAGQPAGVDVTTQPASPEPQRSRPIYRTWCFWIGVGAVVVAGAVTAVVLSSGGGGTDIPGSSLGSRSVFP